MRDVFKNQHGGLWISALEAKFENKGKLFGRKEFDKFLGNYSVQYAILFSSSTTDRAQGLSDIPAALFADELIAAYPDAKIILSTRDEDKWFESMKATIWHLHAARKAASDRGVPFGLLDLEYKHVWGGDPDKFARLKYREHNKHVRDIAPKDRFLEYHVQQGWGPLCAFLGKLVPDTDFPRSDDWASYKREHVAGK